MEIAEPEPMTIPPRTLPPLNIPVKSHRLALQHDIHAANTEIPIGKVTTEIPKLTDQEVGFGSIEDHNLSPNGLETYSKYSDNELPTSDFKQPHEKMDYVFPSNEYQSPPSSDEVPSATDHARKSGLGDLETNYKLPYIDLPSSYPPSDSYAFPVSEHELPSNDHRFPKSYDKVPPSADHDPNRPLDDLETTFKSPNHEFPFSDPNSPLDSYKPRKTNVEFLSPLSEQVHPSSDYDYTRPFSDLEKNHKSPYDDIHTSDLPSDYFKSPSSDRDSFTDYQSASTGSVHPSKQFQNVINQEQKVTDNSDDSTSETLKYPSSYTSDAFDYTEDAELKDITTSSTLVFKVHIYYYLMQFIINIKIV